MDLISLECHVPWTKVLNKQVPIQDNWDWRQWNSVFAFVFSVGNTERTSQNKTHKTSVLRPVPDCCFRRPLGFDHWALGKMKLRRVSQRTWWVHLSVSGEGPQAKGKSELRTAGSFSGELWTACRIFFVSSSSLTFHTINGTLLLVCRSLFSKTCIWLEGKLGGINIFIFSWAAVINECASRKGHHSLLPDLSWVGLLSERRDGLGQKPFPEKHCRKNKSLSPCFDSCKWCDFVWAT